jgi:hypothetical protein
VLFSVSRADTMIVRKIIMDFEGERENAVHTFGKITLKSYTFVFDF